MTRVEGKISYDRLCTMLLAMNGLRWEGDIYYEFENCSDGIRYTLVGNHKQKRRLV